MPALLQPGRKALCDPVWQGISEGILQARSTCGAVRSKGEGVDILSERIKKRKNELKLTYDQIADQLYVTRVAVQNWGLGKALPNSDRIPDICRILQCTPNYLFGFSEVANG